MLSSFHIAESSSGVVDTNYWPRFPVTAKKARIYHLAVGMPIFSREWNVWSIARHRTIDTASPRTWRYFLMARACVFPWRSLLHFQHHRSFSVDWGYLNTHRLLDDRRTHLHLLRSTHHVSPSPSPLDTLVVESPSSVECAMEWLCGGQQYMAFLPPSRWLRVSALGFSAAARSPVPSIRLLERLLIEKWCRSLLFYEHHIYLSLTVQRAEGLCSDLHPEHFFQLTLRPHKLAAHQANLKAR